MNTTTVVAIVIVAIIVVAVVAWLYSRRQQSEQLRERFGPEYDRAGKHYGERSDAEAVLRAREKRAENLNIHRLSGEERERFAQRWHEVETRFVDDPSGAVGAADGLVGEVMKARGYPDTDFDQRLEDISATNPTLADDYRTTHDIALRSQHGDASTEDLRKAMVTYKNMFEKLVGPLPNERREAA